MHPNITEMGKSLILGNYFNDATKFQLSRNNYEQWLSVALQTLEQNLLLQIRWHKKFYL